MAVESYGDLSNYSVDPWGDNITLDERPWYDPLLREQYLRGSVYSQHVAMKIDHNGPAARTIYFNDLIPPRPNITPLSPRKMESTRLYNDSFQREVTTERHGNGFAFHRESEMFLYWQKAGGRLGLMSLIQSQLGQVVTDHLDILARNEYFRHPYAYHGLSSASGFGGIGTDDKMTTDLIDEIWLSLRDRQRPYGALPTHYPIGNEIVCITTSGTIYDLKREVNDTGQVTWIDAHKYSNSVPLIRGELGMWRGVRFVDNGMAKLWNVGETEAQTTITAAVKPGSGAPDPRVEKVERTRKVGQPGAVHYIQVADVTGFEPNMMISIHQLRHDGTTLAEDDNRGVLNGPMFDDPMKQDVEVHSVDSDNNRLVLKEPYMMAGDGGEGLETDLGGGVFGYVTKGATIHTALFLTPGLSNSALVAGVAQAPVIYTPPPFDDYMSVFRVSYDLWLKYALWDARAYDLVFLRGANALTGRRIFR